MTKPYLKDTYEACENDEYHVFINNTNFCKTSIMTQRFFVKQNQTFEKANEMDFDILFVDGHTEKMMIPHIEYDCKTFVFMADLLPTAGHLPLPYVMGYDTRPLLTLDEKERFLQKAATEKYYLILEHDPFNEIITVKHTDKGVRLDQVYTFNDFFNN